MSHSEDIKNAIRSAFDALSADYGPLFTNQFSSGRSTPNRWKWRLYHEIESIDPSIEAIVDGVDEAIQASPERPPTVPMIAKAIRERQKAMDKAARERLEAERIAQLPPPKTRKVDPIAELAKAKKSAFHSPEELRKLVSEHEALIRRDKTLGRIREPRWTERHLCCVPECRNLAVRCASQTGSETWYCREHVEGRA